MDKSAAMLAAAVNPRTMRVGKSFAPIVQVWLITLRPQSGDNNLFTVTERRAGLTDLTASGPLAQSWGSTVMVAYRKIPQSLAARSHPDALSHDLFHGVTPRQMDREARDLAEAAALRPQVRARLEARLIERLKTPLDTPSWGPDWVRDGERHAPQRNGHRPGGLLGLVARRRMQRAQDETASPLSREQLDDTAIIARNLEKSRQVWHYRPLYLIGCGGGAGDRAARHAGGLSDHSWRCVDPGAVQ